MANPSIPVVERETHSTMMFFPVPYKCATKKSTLILFLACQVTVEMKYFNKCNKTDFIKIASSIIQGR